MRAHFGSAGFLILALLLTGATAVHPAWAQATSAQQGEQPEEAKPGLQPIDVVSLRYVLDVFPSPDGSQIAFTRLEPRLADVADAGDRKSVV